MAQFDKDGHLIVKGKQYQVGELTEKLILMQGEELVSFLQSVGLNVPRKLRMGVLKNVLRQSVEKTIEERKSLADEMGYRLTWFSRYTDSQLVNLLEWYKSPSLSKRYLEDLWVALLSYMVDKGVSEADLNQLFNRAFELQNRSIQSTKIFNQQFEDVLFDEKGEIDGVSQAAFRPVTYKASTLTELRAIGDKFDAPIPKRLRKQEVLDIILVKLRDRGTLTAELEAKLSGQNILLLERYAKDNDIKVSTELKKEEIIEYILANAKETREMYFVPSSSAVYEKQVDEVEESFTNESANQVEEPTYEEVIEAQEFKEEVVESQAIQEEVIEEPKRVVEEVRYVQSQQVVQGIDYKPEFDRLARAFETLANAFEKKEFTVNINPIVNIDQNEPVIREVDHSKLIKELLLEDDDFTVSEPHPDPIQQIIAATAPQQVSVAAAPQQSTVVVTQEVKKDKKSVEPKKVDILSPVVVGKTYTVPKKIAGLAGFFALISSFIWLAFAVVLLPFEGINQQAFIQQYITFFDLSQINAWIYVGAGGVLAIYNIILSRFLFNRKMTKAAMIVFGIISLVASFVITGVLMLLGALAKSKPILAPHREDGVGRIVEAINNLGNKMAVPAQVLKKNRVGRVILKVIITILFIAMLAFLILFAIWRLDFTADYASIEIFNLGPLLRDNVIVPIFGSPHA